MIVDDAVVLDTARLGRNHWNLDLHGFARLLGLDPASEYTRERFRDFAELVRLLGRFDARSLDLLGGYEPPPAGGGA